MTLKQNPYKPAPRNQKNNAKPGNLIKPMIKCFWVCFGVSAPSYTATPLIVIWPALGTNGELIEITPLWLTSNAS